MDVTITVTAVPASSPPKHKFEVVFDYADFGTAETADIVCFPPKAGDFCGNQGLYFGIDLRKIATANVIEYFQPVVGFSKTTKTEFFYDSRPLEFTDLTAAAYWDDEKWKISGSTLAAGLVGRNNWDLTSDFSDWSCATSFNEPGIWTPKTSISNSAVTTLI